MNMDLLVNWLFQLTAETSPYYTVYSFLIQTTIYASVTALMIILFKLLLKNKLPAKWHLLIWIVLLIRLVVPNLPTSSVSVFNTAQVDNEVIMQSSYYIVESETEDSENSITENDDYTVSEGLQTIINQEKNGNYIPTFSSGYVLRIDEFVVFVWIGGIILLLGYFITVLSIHNHRLKKLQKQCDIFTVEKLNQCKEKLGIRRDVKVYFADTTPMLIGLFRPVIYLPENYSEAETEYTLIHELSHLKNLDIIWSAIATLILCINWFNPIIWISFFMFKRDIEVFCDERTLRYFTDKQSYAMLLLKTATGKSKFVLGTTSLQNGKADVKRRIKFMSKFRKPTVATVLIASILVYIISTGCLTNAIIKEDKVNVTLVSPANGCKIDFVIDRDLSETDFLGGNGEVLKFTSDLDVETIAKSLIADNQSMGYKIVGEKDVLLIPSNAVGIPYMLLTKRLKNFSGQELDNTVFIECLGYMDDIDDPNMPDIEYSYYFPEYLVADCQFKLRSGGDSFSIRYSNPFNEKIKLRDADDNFQQLIDFYTRMYGWAENYESENGNGRILIENKYSLSGNLMFKIIYNKKDNSVKFRAYPDFAAESSQSVTCRLENAIQRDDRELLESCFISFTDEDYNNFKNIIDISFTQRLIDGCDNVNKKYYLAGFVNIEYRDSVLGFSLYRKHFEIEYFYDKPKIVYTDLVNSSEYDLDYLAFEQTNIKLFMPETIGEPDLSDVHSLSFGELPSVIYADDNRIILFGDCGIIVYDLKQREIILRISYEHLMKIGLSFPLCDASGDGSQVYITDGAEGFGDTEKTSDNYIRLVLDVEGQTLKEHSGRINDVTNRYSTYRLSANDQELYDVDPNYVGGTYVLTENSIVYAQCKPDWSMKNLQIARGNLETGEKEIIDLFKN